MASMVNPPPAGGDFEARVARLIAAVAEGTAEDVRAVLRDGADAVHGAGRHPYWGGSPHALHVAAEWADAEVVRALLEAGADPDVDSREYGGWSPLLIAITRGREDVETVLREAGAYVTAFEASAAGDDTTLAALLARDPEAATRTGPSGASPLHLAATAAVARRLLDAGARIDATDIYGNTPLHTAAARARHDVAAVLMDGGAVPDVHTAVALGMEDRVAALLDADPSLLDQRTFEFAAIGGGGTPLHVAAHLGHPSLIRMLVRRGTAVDVRGLGGITPLHYAAAAGRADAVRLLLELGADPLIRDTVHDGTARDWAGFQRRADVVALLDRLTHPAA